MPRYGGETRRDEKSGDGAHAGRQAMYGVQAVRRIDLRCMDVDLDSGKGKGGQAGWIVEEGRRGEVCDWKYLGIWQE